MKRRKREEDLALYQNVDSKKKILKWLYLPISTA